MKLLSCRVLTGSSWSRSSLLIQRAPKFFEGIIHYCKQFPWELLPCLLVSPSLDKENLKGGYSLLSDRISFLLQSFLGCARFGLTMMKYAFYVTTSQSGVEGRDDTHIETGIDIQTKLTGQTGRPTGIDTTNLIVW